MESLTNLELPMMPMLLKPAQVAEMLDLPIAQVYALVRRNVLPAIHIGRLIRISPAQLAAWLASGGSPRSTGRKKSAA